MQLEGDARPILAQPLGDPPGVGSGRSRALDQGHDLVAVTEQRGEQAAGGLRERPGDRLDPARDSPIQSPASIRPAAESLARTARVTSPARTRAAAACMARAFSSPVASGSYSRKRQSPPECREY